MNTQTGHSEQARYVWETSNLQNAINELTPAALSPLNIEGVNTETFRAVTIGSDLIAVVSNRYKLVQHRDAFAPVVKGLDAIGVEYDYRVSAYKGKATLDVMTTNVADSVRAGFSVVNSVDGKHSIKYNFEVQRTKSYIELVGYRQVCSNGMKIQVPLDEAEIVSLETRTEINRLLEESMKVRHIGNVESELSRIEMGVKLVALLKNPIATMIEKAKAKNLSKKDITALMKAYIGKRMNKEIIAAYLNGKDNTLWGFYNAVTYTASHGKIKESTAGGLLDRSAVMLREQLAPVAVPEVGA